MKVLSWSRLSRGGEDIGKLRVVGGIVDDEMVASVEGTSGEAEVERGFGRIAISHEEAGGAFRGEFFLIIFDYVADGTENMDVSEVWAFLMDEKIG